jgi:hypothetical protein
MGCTQYLEVPGARHADPGLGSGRLSLSELLDRFFQVPSGPEGSFDEHVIGETNVKRLLHIQEDSDRSHRIQTELHELHVVVDGVRLR